METGTNGAYVDGDAVIKNKSNQVSESKIDSSPPGFGKNPVYGGNTYDSA